MKISTEEIEELYEKYPASKDYIENLLKVLAVQCYRICGDHNSTEMDMTVKGITHKSTGGRIGTIKIEFIKDPLAFKELNL